MPLCDGQKLELSLSVRQKAFRSHRLPRRSFSTGGWTCTEGNRLVKRERFTLIFAEEVFRRTRRVRCSDNPPRA
jgi:hypothetical protein